MQTCKRDTFFIAIVAAISFAWIATAKGENTNLLKEMEFAATANAVDEIAYWNEQKLPIRTLIDFPMRIKPHKHTPANHLTCCVCGAVLSPRRVSSAGRPHGVATAAVSVLFNDNKEAKKWMLEGKSEILFPSVQEHSIVTLSERYKTFVPLPSFGEIALIFVSKQNFTNFDDLKRYMQENEKTVVLAYDEISCACIKSTFMIRCFTDSRVLNNTVELLENKKVAAIASRKDLLNQEQIESFNTLIAPSFPLIGYVKSEGEIDEGRNQLRMAFDKAISDIQIPDVSGNEFLNKHGIANSLECYRIEDDAKIEKIPSRGIFHKIITKKHIKIGFVSTHVKGWLDTDNFDKNDVLSEWLENILQRTFASRIVGLWEHFKVERKVYSSYSKLCAALRRGEVDVILSAPCPHTQRTCSPFTVFPAVLVKNLEKNLTLAKFAEKVATEKDKKILVTGEQFIGLSKIIFPGIPLSRVRVCDSETIVKKLNENDKYAAAIIESLAPTNLPSHISHYDVETIRLAFGLSVSAPTTTSASVRIFWAFISLCGFCATILAVSALSQTIKGTKDAQKGWAMTALGWIDRISLKFEQNKESKRKVELESKESDYVPPTFSDSADDDAKLR